MSIKGSLVGYEENNKAAAAAEKKHKYTVLQTQHTKHVKSKNTHSYMGKNCTPSLNSSITNSIVTNAGSVPPAAHNQQQHNQNSSHRQSQQCRNQASSTPLLGQNSGTELLQQKYMNSKRKYAKYNSMHPDHMTLMDQGGSLHLNSLWSIWYGVLLTLFQGYLAVHGAYRFLGCSLIPWKIEPVAELNLQIILSGVVFILLPLFFTSAVFKVGNLANDGIKLAASPRERRCSMTPHDGLEEEANGGTLRALWTHGGPTAAFVHIVIALCLLLPRLLLEAKIIENGLLPKENIWQTELDFVAVNRRNLIVLSVISAPYQNITSIEDDDYYNDTMFMAVDNGHGGSNRREYMDVNNNRIDNNLFITQTVSTPTTTTTTTTTKSNIKISIENTKTLNKNKPEGRLFEVPDLIKNKKDNYENNLNNASSQEDIVTDEMDVIDKSDIDDNNSQGKYNENTVVFDNGLDEENVAKESSNGGVSIDVESFDTNDYFTTNNPQTSSPTTIMMETTSQSKQKINEETTNKDWDKLGKQYGITLTNEQSAETSTKMTTTKATTKTTTTTTTTAKNVNKIGHYESTILPTTTPITTIKSITTTYDYTNPPTQPTRTHHRNHHTHNGKVGRKHGHRQHRQRLAGHRRHNASMQTLGKQDSNEEQDIGKNGMRLYAKSTAMSSYTTRDSNIHIVKPEKLPEIIPSTPVSSNSKIFEIKTKTRRLLKRAAEIITSQVEIEPEYLVSDLAYNDSNEYFATTVSSTIQNNLTTAEESIIRLDGFSGMLQILFGIEKPIDVNVFAQPPSAEFINLLFALLVWCVRYPAVFWTTTKSFASVFSVQLVFSALDLIFGYIGVSNLYKLQIYSEAVPIQNPGLILNGVVTLALYLLSSALIIASSMIMYLYGHGRLAAKMRARSLITLKSSETWIYFAHCASLCYVLALAVVKAPLLNDLSATYRNNLHCPTFLSALVSVVHLLLWIVIWLGLTAKRRWTFKLPPLDAYGITKATTQPLLLPNRPGANSVGGSVISKDDKSKTAANVVDNNSALNGNGNVAENQESGGNSEVGSGNEDIYWPKLAPNSPKLKVTFNEVTSTSDDVLLIGDHVEQSGDGKRNSTRGTAVCFTSIAGEIDDGEYATLRAATAATVVGIGLNSKSLSGGLAGTSIHTPTGGSIKILHLSEYDELPPPPLHPQQQVLSSTTTVGVGVADYANYNLGDDSTSEEGKLLACVRDDSVTYASTRDLEPPQPPPPPPPPPTTMSSTTNNNNNNTNNHNNYNTNNKHKYISSINGRAPQAVPEVMQVSSSSPEHLVSPLAPVNVTVHTNEAHITSSSTPRCLRRADSGVPNEALTPRSDTTESTTSPPERAPSESSSGVHSGEERDVEVVIRPRVGCKPSIKPPQPVIQEEPYGRCTNMRMSSFNADPNTRNTNALNSSATLPPQRTGIEPKINYPHCSTMPLPAGCHSQQNQANRNSNPFTTASAQSMHAGVSSFKGNIVYANSAIAMANAVELQQYAQQHNPFEQIQQQQQKDATEQKSTHTTLPNGIRYTNPQHLLRRLPHMSQAESPYGHLGLGAGHHTFSKLLQDPLHTQSSTANSHSLMNTVILEDRDSANYSMSSETDYGLYATANFH